MVVNSFSFCLSGNFLSFLWFWSTALLSKALSGGLGALILYYLFIWLLLLLSYFEHIIALSHVPQDFCWEIHGQSCVCDKPFFSSCFQNRLCYWLLATWIQSIPIKTSPYAICLGLLGLHGSSHHLLPSVWKVFSHCFFEWIFQFFLRLCSFWTPTFLSGSLVVSRKFCRLSSLFLFVPLTT